MSLISSSTTPSVAPLRRHAALLMLVLSLAVASVVWGWLVSPALADTARAKSRAVKQQYGCRNRLTGKIRPLAKASAKCRFNEVRVVRQTTTVKSTVGPQGATGDLGPQGA